MVINSKFRKSVDRKAALKMLAKDAELFVTASERRVLFFLQGKLGKRSLVDEKIQLFARLLNVAFAIPTTEKRFNKITFSGLDNYSIGQSNGHRGIMVS